MVMKLFFVHHAIAFTTDLPRLTYRLAAFRGHEFLIYDGHKVWGEADTRKPRYCAASGSYYFLRLTDSVFVLAGHGTDDDNFNSRIDPAKLATYVSERLLILTDPEGYSLRAKAAIAEASRQRIEADRERREAEAEQERIALESARVAFRSGQAIDLTRFEQLCREYGVSIPIRTIGSARKSVQWIKHDSMSLRGKSRPNLLPYATELYAVLSRSDITIRR